MDDPGLNPEPEPDPDFDPDPDGLFEDVPSDLLEIVRSLEDDFFVGTMSKYVFRRALSCLQKKLLLEEELAFYILHQLRPTLSDILRSGQGSRFYVWLAMEISFVKLIDDSGSGLMTDHITRWSSMRNRTTFTGQMHTEQERTAFIEDFTSRFAQEVVLDVTEMELLYESGWVFRDVAQAHLRFVAATPLNILRFSGRMQTTSTFNKETKRLFYNYVVDPRDLFHHDQGAPLCVPQAIILSLLINLHGTKASALKYKQLTVALEALNFKTLLKSDGISFYDIPRIEAINKPIPERLLDCFPQLSGYLGLAINIFAGRMVRTGDGQTHFHLTPKLLSRKHSDFERYYNVDLLIDHHSFRNIPNKSTSQGQKHMLAITSLVRMCTRRNPLMRNNAPTYQFICRKCLRPFQRENDFLAHSRTCLSFPAARVFQPRRAWNSKIYRPYRHNKMTHRMEQNFVAFKRGELYKTLRPLTSSFIGHNALENLSFVVLVPAE